MDKLMQKNKLDSLACKLGTLVSSLKTDESKILVNKNFNIVLDLLFPEKCQKWDNVSGRKTLRIYSSPIKQQSHSIQTKPRALPQIIFS
jgi:hypothetical protein